MFYVILMVTTMQKLITEIQKIKKKESKHTTTENHQIKEREGERERERRE